MKEDGRMKISEMRELLGVSRAEFSRQYGIPVRTLENWESGKSNCPEYVNQLLERAVREDAVKFTHTNAGGRIMRTGKWVSHRKPVKLGKAIKTIETSWGAMYSLHKEYDGDRYFADVSEGFGEVEQIVADDDDQAIEIFKSWMRNLEDEVVPKYRIIDVNERNAASNLKEYTLEQAKAFFEPDEDDLPGYHEKWEEIEDVDDLREYLEWEAAGMSQHYKIEEVEK